MKQVIIEMFANNSAQDNFEAKIFGGSLTIELCSAKQLKIFVCRSECTNLATDWLRILNSTQTLLMTVIFACALTFGQTIS